MNTKILGLIVLGVLLLVGGGLFVANQQSLPVEDTPMTQEITATTQADSSLVAQTDRYIKYSKSALDGAASNRRVLFFYASWCPTCIAADADLRANISKIPTDVTVIQVNYNDPATDQEEKDLAQKYSVTYQHTFVQIDEQGNQVAVWNGGNTDELLEKIK